MIAALEKAESLHRFAVEQGARLGSFALTLSDSEALEILDWFVAQHPPSELLNEDMLIAHATANPWPVLANFQLMGFAIVPKAQLH